MHLFVAALFVFVHVNAQETSTLDADVLLGVFGPPPTTTERSGGLDNRVESRRVTITTPTPASTTKQRTEPRLLTTTTPTPATTTELCDIQRNTTEKNEFTNNDGESCKCVPYYLCDANRRGININNASVTGYGQLDIRFGNDDCQESLEVCCTEPKNASDVIIPKPAKPKGCGYRNPEGVDVKIEGGDGDEAQFGEFPWVVALKDNNNNSYSGVGALIHPQVVLTAAHNVYLYGSNSMIVRAGEWDTQTEKEILPHQERVVEEIVLNEDFIRRNVFNDIAILRLNEPFELAAHINVICLPNQGENFDESKKCAVGGWGKDKFGLIGRYAVFLKKIEQDMIPNHRCEQLLKKTRLGNRFKLHNSFVCAGGEVGKDTCQGDGGAPLVCPIGDNRYKLTGLVSWGIGCGEKDIPAVYAAVPNFREWVDSKMAAWGYDTSGYKV